MTDAIFEQLDFELEEAQADPSVLRLQIQRLTHSKLEGLPDLGKWFVDISYRPG
ncbi:MAG: hypothetical protein MH252_05820 [Thermosynechococcaceae cyanobacterium MS004]|nr:hypothetical protein [Thermosynechococcaceae cyanobacterium MS004]